MNEVSTARAVSPRAPLIGLPADFAAQRATAERVGATASTPDDVIFFVFSLRGGGAERVVSRLANAWPGGGRVVVVTETAAEDDQYALDARVVRLSTLTAAPGATRLQRATNFALKVARFRALLRRLRIRRVVSLLCRSNNIAALSCLGLNCDLIVSERNDPRFNPETGLDRFLRPMLYRTASAVVVQTDALAGVMKQRYRFNNLAVIPNPVVAPACDGATSTTTRPYILGIGRLTPQKGFDLLISAYAQSAAKEAFDLVILGEGPARADLERQVAASALQDHVHLAGHSEDPFPALAGAAMFVLSSRYEGFPNVLLEAMISGCAVITTDFPSGAHNFVRAGVDGLIVPPGDVVALSDAIDRLASDPALRDALAKSAREAVSIFSAERIVPQWRALA